MEFNINWLSSLVFLSIGYSIGKSENDDIKSLIEDAIETYKQLKDDFGVLIVDFLEKLENADTDELRINFFKWISEFSEKLSNFIEEESK